MQPSIEDYLQRLHLGDGTTSLMIQVFLIIFFALLLDFSQKRLLRRLHARVEASRQLWDDALIYALNRPLSLLIWLLGITLAAELLGRHTEAEIFTFVTPLREVGVIVIIALFFHRLIAAMEANVLERARRQERPLDKTTVDAIGKLLRISVSITALLIALQTLGFSISGVLAFGGVGGIAVGFAAKDLLANFFGGLTIYLDRPFSEGDWIRSPDRAIEGTVEKIGWRLTCIRTFDKRPLYVPNATFTSIAVENPSRMTNRRIKETIGIRYDDAGRMAEIIADVRTMLEGHPEIDTAQTLIVNFDSFAPSSLDFFIYTFTRTTEWVRFHAIKQDVLLKVIAIIEDHGAEIAFPTSTLHIPQGVVLEGTLNP